MSIHDEIRVEQDAAEACAELGAAAPNHADVIWVTQSGARMRVGDMSQNHRVNVWRLLQRKTDQNELNDSAIGQALSYYIPAETRDARSPEL